MSELSSPSAFRQLRDGFDEIDKGFKLDLCLSNMYAKLYRVYQA